MGSIGTRNAYTLAYTPLCWKSLYLALWVIPLGPYAEAWMRLALHVVF